MSGLVPPHWLSVDEVEGAGGASRRCTDEWVVAEDSS